MKIGIIGCGNVGGTLGKRWAQNGHDVVFGSRDPNSEKMQTLVKQAGSKATGASNVEAVSASEILLVSTPWRATQTVLTSLGKLSNKIVMDATNPVLPTLDGVSVDQTTSAGEQVQAWTGAKVVKVFNTVGANIMADPSFKEGPPVMFYCGDDAAAKATVASLVDELGFKAVDAGPLKQARILEYFALLWISLAMKQGFGRDIAFRFLRR